jgi:hypothetical protein
MKLERFSFLALIAEIDPRRSWTGYLITAGAILAIGIALLSPEISSNLGFPGRLLFWFAHVGCALAITEGIQLLLGRAAFSRHLSPLVMVLIAGAIGALFFSAFSILVLERALHPLSSEPAELVSLLGSLQEFRHSSGQVMVFWVLLNGPRLIMIAQDRDETSDAAPVAADTPITAVREPQSPARPAIDPALVEFMGRLPRRMGTDIVAMTAELHYLRVYTRHGDALILMSFGRAVKALQVLDGLAVHRSHWVATSHVVRLETDGDRVVCRLDTGLSVPVSRGSRARLRKAITERDRRMAERALSTLAAQDLVRT